MSDNPPSKKDRATSVAEVREIVAKQGSNALEYLALQLIATIPGYPDVAAHLEAGLELIKGIDPQDTLEQMLATQMVATHNAIMDCMSRVATAQSSNAREFNLKQAARLMAVWVRQLDALNKHRGKGHQMVTVNKFVNVGPGAQAVVGNVEARPKSPPSERPGEALTITNAPHEPLPVNGRTKKSAKVLKRE